MEFRISQVFCCITSSVLFFYGRKVGVAEPRGAIFLNDGPPCQGATSVFDLTFFYNIDFKNEKNFLSPNAVM